MIKTQKELDMFIECLYSLKDLKDVDRYNIICRALNCFASNKKLVFHNEIMEEAK